MKSNKNKLIKAKLYKVVACNSVFEKIHGLEYELIEIFIPKYNICVNFHNGKHNYFKSEEARGTFIKNILFPKNLAEKTLESMEIQEEVSKEYKDIDVWNKKE